MRLLGAPGAPAVGKTLSELSGGVAVNQTDRLHAILAEKPGQIIPTEDIQLALGTTRACVRVHACALRHRGEPVTSVFGLGYMLGAVADKSAVRVDELLDGQEREDFLTLRGFGGVRYIGNAAALRAIGRADLLGEQA